jgi:GDP/UDP-N,N'-diacetylbacillosamine 2-epimerase (hydrolysing)
MKKKICIVTGTRADYGLFYPLLKRLECEHEFEVRIVATGMHLSPEFGLTYKEIEEDGFIIDEKVEMLLSSDTATGITKSIGIGILSFADAFERSRPELVIVLGDRFETFSAAVAAFIAGIPVAHLHGGEITEGAMDDSLRHSITKMSYLHFTAAERYRERVIQLGESPDRVFNVGALGIDTIKRTHILTKQKLEQALHYRFQGITALVTYHPATLEINSAEQQFRELLNALDSFPDLNVIFTLPNADAGGRVIVRLIQEYAVNNPQKARAFVSMGRVKYLSAMNYGDVVIGNSSSGIIEAPSFHKPTVNIGDRQKGRLKADSIINCRPRKDAIEAAIKKALSDDFRNECMNVTNPFGEGNAAEKIVDILRDTLSRRIDVKKNFYDFNEIMNGKHFDNYNENAGEVDARERHINC